jgi:hypothetical protein
MLTDQHNRLSRLLHDIYLGNPSIAELSFDLEALMAGNISAAKESVFVTGLARSGTTSVFNHIYQSGEYASLLYSDMPFLLMPNLWGKRQLSSNTTKTERFHGDNIMVGADSPEALDEFFWKVYLKNKYISKDFLSLHHIDKAAVSAYDKYVSLICSARNKNKYLSKNNNNILRLSGLNALSIPQKVIMLYRDPLEHASSLMKLHLKFSSQQLDDNFILRYFNYLGHHEFGLGQKTFFFDSVLSEQLKHHDKSTFDFWLLSWLNYYSYVVNHYLDDITLVSFKDICDNPKRVYGYINEQLAIKPDNQYPDPYMPPSYDIPLHSATLLHECMKVYERLNTERKYT